MLPPPPPTEKFCPSYNNVQGHDGTGTHSCASSLPCRTLNPNSALHGWLHIYFFSNRW